MARVYLETSFISACVTRRTDVASLYRKQVSSEWWETQRSRHELFVSAEVTEELSHPKYPQSTQALELVNCAAMLEIGQAVHGFAEILVRERVMPGPAKGDAIHVAAATVHGCEYMLSWNVRHLANRSKLTHLLIVCTRSGLVAPQIITPELLWEYANE